MFTPAQLASVALRQQTAGLEDARARAERAAEAREAAELQLEQTEQAHREAIAASEADRNDDAKADAAARAAMRLAHVRKDLDQAIAKHEQAAAAVATAERHVTEADRTLRIVELQDRFEDGSHEVDSASIGRAIVERVVDIQRLVLALRERLEDDAAIVRQIAELGGPRLDAPDGVAAAGAFCEAIVRADGAIAAQVHEYRWAFLPPSTAASVPDRDGSVAASKLVALVLGALAQAARNAAHGHQSGRAELAKVADVWQRHRSHGSAQRELDELARQEGEARAKRETGAHADRLARAKLEADANRGKPVMATTPRPPVVKPMVHPIAREQGWTDDETWTDGERVIGDRFDVPVG
jgi:hypothetical protein